LHVLYNLLLAPFEDLLPNCGSSPRIGRRELILVLEDSLYLVPFAILRSCDDQGEFLSERCSLLTVPSLQALRQKNRFKKDNVENINSALVVGVSLPLSSSPIKSFTLPFSGWWQSYEQSRHFVVRSNVSGPGSSCKLYFKVPNLSPSQMSSLLDGVGDVAHQASATTKRHEGKCPE
jgi:CHAT domain